MILLLILMIFAKKFIRPEAALKFRIPGTQDFAISSKLHLIMNVKADGRFVL